MTVRKYLEQGIHLQAQIEEENRECLRLEKLMESVQSPGFEPHYGSGSGEAPFVRGVEKLMEAKEALKASMNLLMELYAQISLLLSQVPDPKARRIMRMYYLEGRTWPDIMDETGWSLSYLSRLCCNGMKELVLMPDAIDISKQRKLILKPEESAGPA